MVEILNGRSSTKRMLQQARRLVLLLLFVLVASTVLVAVPVFYSDTIFDISTVPIASVKKSNVKNNKNDNNAYAFAMQHRQLEVIEGEIEEMYVDGRVDDDNYDTYSTQPPSEESPEPDNDNDNDGPNSNNWSCVDSRADPFLLFKYRLYGCSDILYADSYLRPQLCSSSQDVSNVEGHEHQSIKHTCPIACGMCCADDPDYRILRHNGLQLMFEDCQWLGESESRREFMCDRFNNGRMVRVGCPMTCDACHYTTEVPSESPTSAMPTASPSDVPSASKEPSTVPSTPPTPLPSSAPSASQAPSDTPTHLPSSAPSASPAPSDTPSASLQPTTSPTSDPTEEPSIAPTTVPTGMPSIGPSDEPTASPSIAPSAIPTSSIKPSATPSHPPTASPTRNPTRSPTENPTSSPTMTQPNLIFIMTDEHNLRTISSYRHYLASKVGSTKTDVWGDGLVLDTPHIDALAREGAMYTNYYTASPLCTPSRASFMSGMYPSFCGDADHNHGSMDWDIVTWAEVLRRKGGRDSGNWNGGGYHTGYMGKWHLDGTAKPGWGNNGRDFGFVDNKYRYNRGHWKYFDEDWNGNVQEYEISGEGLFQGREDQHFTTDFLIDRGIEFVNDAVDKGKPFALMLSIPDPHGPNEVRSPYRNKYDHLNFKVPETAKRSLKHQPAPPMWSFLNKDEVHPSEVDEWVVEYEEGKFWQKHMRQYYGMVKCIDDNIGKLMTALKNKGIDNDTIVVFTADHGDLLMEHSKLNKNRPYEMSAGVPFIVRYPDKVPAGKIVQTARSSIDFAPTILGLMGMPNPSGVSFQGVDGSQDLLSGDSLVKDDSNIIFSFATGNSPDWAAAIKDGYKLIIHRGDIPWFFDLNEDPEEMDNRIKFWSYKSIVQELRESLVKAMADYNVDLQSNFIYLDPPLCRDKREPIPINKAHAFCTDLGVTMNESRCDSNTKVRSHCPQTCGFCQCRDSDGPFWLENYGMKYCSDVANGGSGLCSEPKVSGFCPNTCGNTNIC